MLIRPNATCRCRLPGLLLLPCPWRTHVEKTPAQRLTDEPSVSLTSQNRGPVSRARYHRHSGIIDIIAGGAHSITIRLADTLAALVDKCQDGPAFAIFRILTFASLPGVLVWVGPHSLHTCRLHHPPRLGVIMAPAPALWLRSRPDVLPRTRRVSPQLVDRRLADRPAAES